MVNSRMNTARNHVDVLRGTQSASKPHVISNAAKGVSNVAQKVIVSSGPCL